MAFDWFVSMVMSLPCKISIIIFHKFYKFYLRHFYLHAISIVHIKTSLMIKNVFDGNYNYFPPPHKSDFSLSLSLFVSVYPFVYVPCAMCSCIISFFSIPELLCSFVFIFSLPLHSFIQMIPINSYECILHKLCIKINSGLPTNEL